ncbi:cytoskeleton-associated protein 2-like isoform X1 [Amblyraja radiata]|uniref:cytoskeleton-associated protein 2-like isoform X1 n=1 Tax=Amblyraja radiata TaxID=386614 RepID=UPI0014033F3A|nr:cytoskeleton-associated protein 2-like isoform X1 [Amblyraja radiata]
MEARARSGSVRMAESELRRQQLEAYLQRKGKLKVPGLTDRYYLGDKNNLKIQPRTAPFKVGLGNAQKHDAHTKQCELQSTNNPSRTNHVKSIAARNQVQHCSRTAEKNPALTQTVSMFPQVTTALFPMESNAEREIIVDESAQERQCLGNLKPENSTHYEFIHNSSNQEKENKCTVGTAQTAGQSTSTVLMNQLTQQVNETQISRLKGTPSDNHSWAIGIDNIDRVVPAVLRPVGKSGVAPTQARPVSSSRVAPVQARPVGRSRAAPAQARPVGRSRAPPAAARPVGKCGAAPAQARPVGRSRAPPAAARLVGRSRTAPNQARPVISSRAAPAQARPVSSSRAAPAQARPVISSRAAPAQARPVSSSRAAPAQARPVSSSRAAPAQARPVGRSRAAPAVARSGAVPSAPKVMGSARPSPRAAKPVSRLGAAPCAAKSRRAPRAAKQVSSSRALTCAAKSTGGMTAPNEPSKAEVVKSCGKLSKTGQQCESEKTMKSPCIASRPNGSNSIESRSLTIWKPFTRSAQRLHPTLVSPTRNIKVNKDEVQNISKLAASVMSTAKQRDDQSSITKTLKGKDERRKQLEEWLASKGKTYKRPPMPTPLKKVLKSVKKNLECSFLEALEEEQKSLADRVHHMLNDCMKLLERGSSPEQVSEALRNVPDGEKFAKYWICQAHLLELTGTMEAIIALFEQAVHSGAEPVEELRSALVETIMRNVNSHTSCTEKEDVKTEGFEESAVATPRTTVVESLFSKIDGRGSSMIKYRVTATPQVLRTNQLQSKIQSYGKQDLKFLTPVRRSVRIEHVSAWHPEMLREHDCCVASLNELLDEDEAETFVYRENKALLE